MSQRTQSTTMQPAPAGREDLQALSVQGEAFLRRFSTALQHDAERRAAEVHQPITDKDLQDDVMAMINTLKSWIQAPNSGCFPQLVLPRLFLACFEEVEERRGFIRSILVPPGASTTNTTTTAMRDHIVEHHETLFHLTPGKEHEEIIARILNRVGDFLAKRHSFSKQEAAQVVLNGDFDKVVVAYLRIVVRVRMQDPDVHFKLSECGTVLCPSNAGLTKKSGSFQTAEGVDVSKFEPEMHSSELSATDKDRRQRQLYIVVFPAVLVDDALLTKSYTMDYMYKTKHESGMAPVADCQDHRSSTGARDLPQMNPATGAN